MKSIFNLKFKLILLGFYLVSAASTFAFFSYQSDSQGDLISPLAPSTTSTTSKFEKILDVDPSAPLTEACPLNGKKYTVVERQAWEKRRPLAVMIENHLDARPQSGLSTADIVYETVAEGGITRFMAVYYCDVISQNLTIGPVRSARTYFLDWVSEYSKYPLYVHVGGANTPNKANALGQIETYGWAGANNLNQFGLSVKECQRDYNRLGREVATEHTMYCFSEALWKEAARRGFAAEDKKGDSWTDTFTPWKFSDTLPKNTTPASNINFDFWKDYKQYAVNWTYVSDQQVYKRSNGGESHIDKNTGEQLTTTTIVVQFATETGPIDELKHMLYGTIDTGKAVIFSHGQASQVTWTKKARLSRTVFTDSSGKEFQFQPGKIWIEVLAKGNKIDYN